MDISNEKLEQIARTISSKMEKKEISDNLWEAMKTAPEYEEIILPMIKHVIETWEECKTIENFFDK